jgi:hypothetical protein
MVSSMVWLSVHVRNGTGINGLALPLIIEWGEFSRENFTTIEARLGGLLFWVAITRAFSRRLPLTDIGQHFQPDDVAQGPQRARETA